MRPANKHDVKQMQQLYAAFSRQFVGPALRTPKSFARMLRKKDNINYVAVDRQNQIVGYVHAAVDKRNHMGDIREIIVHPERDFTEIANSFVEKVNADFVARKVSFIVAASIRNPAYEKVFPKLGFFESESMGVFMYAVLDVHRLLNELWPVLANRLKHVGNWRGLAQMECDGHSVFFKKTDETVETVVWTNQLVDLKVKLSATILAKLIFGVVSPLECFRTGQLSMETTIRTDQAEQVLESLFPQKQFLIMDHW